METGVVVGIGLLFYLAVASGFGAYVALEKGRPTSEGIIFAVVLGPIGILIIACLPIGPGLKPPPPPKAPSMLTANPDDVGDPVELERWLKRGGK